MTIVFGFDDVGGFIAGDTVTGRTSYAYPSSHHAVTAKRSAVRTAVQMMRQENENTCRCQHADQYDARNWARLPTRMDDTNSLEG